MRKKIGFLTICFVFFCFLLAPFAFAERAETSVVSGVSIFVGPEYMRFGSIKVDGRRFADINDFFGFKIGAGYEISDNFGVEVAWSRFSLDEAGVNLPRESKNTFRFALDANYFSLSPTFKWKVAKGVALNGALGAYWCQARLDVEDVKLSEKDSGGALGTFCELGFTVSPSSSLYFNVTGGYRDGKAVGGFFNRQEIETKGSFFSALCNVAF